jgi:23S rRNA (pseudouridine1915-N3)-methyltransferase
MLALHVITVGRDKEIWVSAQIDHYRKMIGKYARLELTTVPESPYGKKADLAKALAQEADVIRSRLKGGCLIALAVEGKSWSTEKLAEEIQKIQNAGQSLIEFVVGGPYGIDASLKRQADLCLSLSPLTVSHQIARLVLMEQLYRVLNLAAGGQYHK